MRAYVSCRLLFFIWFGFFHFAFQIKTNCCGMPFVKKKKTRIVLATQYLRSNIKYIPFLFVFVPLRASVFVSILSYGRNLYLI